MTITFYPHEDELENSSMQEKLEILLEAAERYKAIVLDIKNIPKTEENSKKRQTPREITAAYNWEEITKLLREIRELPEANPISKASKAQSLMKLAEIYEVLRGAKMPKLEAVRIALSTEANQLMRGS